MRKYRWQIWKVPSYTLLVFLLFHALTVVLQYCNNAYANEFGSHSDEAGHFVTGVLVHDFLVSGRWSSPMEYARDYYLHYPKIGLGHWPPVFYVVQAVWELLFGVSHTSLMSLMAAISALTATTIYLLIRTQLPGAASVGIAALLLLTPAYRHSTAVLLADPLCALFTLWASVAWSHFLSRPTLCASACFGFLSSLAILTKGNALLLALLPPTTLLLTGQWRLLKAPALWASPLVVGSLCGPWYVFAAPMQKDGMVGEWFSMDFICSAARVFSAGTLTVLGSGVFVLAFVGALRSLSTARANDGRFALRATMLATILSTLMFHCFVPAGRELRYLLFLVPAALYLAADAVEFLQTSCERGGVVRVAIAGALILAVAGSTAFARYGIVRPSRGFAILADDVGEKSTQGVSVALVSSDVLGEGMFISECVMRDRRLETFALRASKLLASSRWLGDDYRIRYQELDDVAHCLREVGVGMVVIDRSIDDVATPEHHQLKTLVERSSEGWRLVSRHALCRQGRFFPNALEVYRRPQPRSVTRQEAEALLKRIIASRAPRRTDGQVPPPLFALSGAATEAHDASPITYWPRISTRK